ncbi:hypothetical protein NLU14_20645 [Marinobacter sp. 71-i]|uniref:Uncharacterized protein n=1 Tax=Marinobacter iranensis TaxID=2962607 RepID=A0ABT5YG16_9GAMM|nr:hypothetical protein [Marinobacter iranensis]MDF0752641.1 hypothetical protein [Marinobacter iranensis]
MQHQDLEDIRSRNKRVAFSAKEALELKDFIETSIDRGCYFSLDSIIGRNNAEVKKALLDGVIIIRTDMSDVCILFIKMDLGKGIFGGQKSKVMSFTGSSSESSYTPGRVFRNLSAALNRILQL